MNSATTCFIVESEIPHFNATLIFLLETVSEHFQYEALSNAYGVQLCLTPLVITAEFSQLYIFLKKCPLRENFIIEKNLKVRCDQLNSEMGNECDVFQNPETVK